MVSDRDAARPTRARYLIAGMLFVSVVINYLDRANLSVAAPQLAKDLGFDTSGQFVGLAFLSPVLYALQNAFGWQMVFLVTGGVGVLWAAVWYACYREPKECRAANAAEIKLIKDGGGFVDLAAAHKTRAGFHRADLITVLSHRKLWGLYLGQILFLSLAFFGNGLASITWSLVSAIAPERLLGLTGGMFNFVGNLASVGVPIAIGQLVKGGDFAPAITLIAALAVAGAICYGLVVGKVERIAA